MSALIHPDRDHLIQLFTIVAGVVKIFQEGFGEVEPEDILGWKVATEMMGVQPLVLQGTISRMMHTRVPEGAVQKPPELFSGWCWDH